MPYSKGHTYTNNSDSAHDGAVQFFKEIIQMLANSGLVVKNFHHKVLQIDRIVSLIFTSKFFARCGFLPVT